MGGLNIVAVIVAAVVMFAIGWAWYGPLFGKPWRKLMGIGEEQMKTGMQKGDMVKNMSLVFIGGLVMVFVLASSMARVLSLGSNMSPVALGIHNAFWSWLGFIAPATLGTVLWDKRPWKLWIINNAYYLVSLIVAGIIIGMM